MSDSRKKVKENRAVQIPDSRLVRACLRGDESAWSALIDKYKNLIFSIPLRYGLSQEDSADILQSVCMDLLTELPNIREPNALGGWLIQVTRNRCLRQKRQDLIQPFDQDELPEVGDNREDLVMQVQREQELREAMWALSERCRKLVEMLFFETPARPYQDIAKDLKLATGSIGFVRRRCLDKLRRELERVSGASH